MTQTIYSSTDKLQFNMPRSAHTQHFVTWQRTGCAHLSGCQSVSLIQLEVLNLLLVQLCLTYAYSDRCTQPLGSNVFFKHFELEEVLPFTALTEIGRWSQRASHTSLKLLSKVSNVEVTAEGSIVSILHSAKPSVNRYI